MGKDKRVKAENPYDLEIYCYLKRIVVDNILINILDNIYYKFKNIMTNTNINIRSLNDTIHNS